MSGERWQELDERAAEAPWGVAFTGDNVTDSQGGTVADLMEPVDAVFIAAARTAWPAAERECVQLRADNDRWREQGTAWVEQHVALARENDQLRAERDRLREVVLVIRDSGVAHPLILEAIGSASGLLDDEGQQR